MFLAGLIREETRNLLPVGFVFFNPNSEIKVKGSHHAEARKREGWKWKIPFLQEFVFLRASAPPRELRLSG